MHINLGGVLLKKPHNHQKTYKIWGCFKIFIFFYWGRLWIVRKGTYCYYMLLFVEFNKHEL